MPPAAGRGLAKPRLPTRWAECNALLSASHTMGAAIARSYIATDIVRVPHRCAQLGRARCSGRATFTHVAYELAGRQAHFYTSDGAEAWLGGPGLRSAERDQCVLLSCAHRGARAERERELCRLTDLAFRSGCVHRGEAACRRALIGKTRLSRPVCGQLDILSQRRERCGPGEHQYYQQERHRKCRPDSIPNFCSIGSPRFEVWSGAVANENGAIHQIQPHFCNESSVTFAVVFSPAATAPARRLPSLGDGRPASCTGAVSVPPLGAGVGKCWLAGRRPLQVQPTFHTERLLSSEIGSGGTLICRICSSLRRICRSRRGDRRRARFRIPLVIVSAVSWHSISSRLILLS
jgi:hypothetical protein